MRSRREEQEPETARTAVVRPAVPAPRTPTDAPTRGPGPAHRRPDGDDFDDATARTVAVHRYVAPPPPDAAAGPARPASSVWFDAEPVPVRRAGPRPGPVVLAAAAGSLVSVALGVYGRLHEPTSVAINLAGFSSGTAVKAWLATAAAVLVVVQVATARRALGGGGRIASGVHRWSGRAAVLLTVPVAVHCLYALGFQPTTPRVLAHSLAGCALYGAFVAKMLLLPRDGVHRLALPVFGGLLAVAFTTVWLTSALWFFGTSGLTF